jgi:ABC-type multidrug transport system ATPase subunit
MSVWLEARAVTRAYGRKVVLRDVNFRASEGELWVVLGHNGSGKSTLLKILAGLLRPTSGHSELHVDGVGHKGPERRRQLGLVSPEISPYPELSGLENMDFAARLRSLPRDTETLEAALVEVGLKDATRKLVGSYSSGMKQRLKLALAIQHRPRLLLLDEPTALLDAEGRGRVAEIVRERLSKSIIFWATNEPGELPTERREIRLS